MTRISASVLFTPYSKHYILTELNANDVKFISSDRQELDLSKYIEDIYFFEVNNKYISSSAVGKKSVFSRVRSTSEHADIFTARDYIYLVFAEKK